MMLATLGAPVALRFKPVDLKDLVIGRKGEIFAIYIKADGIRKEKAGEYLSELKKVIEENDAELLFGTVYEDGIFLQIKGSPFAWPALLAAIPPILASLGVFVIALSVWQATSRNEWILPIIIVGSVAIIFGPDIIRSFRGD